MKNTGSITFAWSPPWWWRTAGLGHAVLVMGFLVGTAVAANAQTGTIQGRVSEAATGQPIASAVVTLIGTTIGTETAQDGRFVLMNVPAGRQRVRVRSLGHTAATIQITVTVGLTAAVDVELQRSVIELDAIVVTGTAGEVRKRSVGNSLSQINVAELLEPALDVDAVLQAQAPGVTVLKSSAMSGGGAQIRLRGNVSVTQSNQPLIYVDGIRIRSDGYPKNVPPILYQGRSGNDVASPLNDIDPGDIERIEIIKGAAATTLYGTEAASGVIQIFTKKGRRGPARWTFRMDQGFNHVLKFGPDVDWQGTGESDPSYMFIEPFLKDAWRQKYALSVSGGSEELQYYVGGSYEDNNGVLPNDWQQKASVRGNFGFSPFEDLRFEVNTSYTNNDIRNTPAGNNAQGITLNAYRRDRNYVGSENVDTIAQVLDFDLRTYIDRYIAGFTARYAPSEKFLHRFTIGYDLALSEMRSVRPLGYRFRPFGIMSNRRWSNTTLTLDYLGTVNLDLADELRSSLSWGGQTITSNESDIYGYGQDLAPGDPTLSSAATTLSFEDRIRGVTGGFFVQNLLAFKDRYFLTAGVRVDGNSAFGKALGLEPYPKASLSYVISEEPFWPDALGTLKLRAAWGQAGRAPDAFGAARTWDPVGWGGEPAYRPLNLGNDSLGPERTTEIELGFEGGLFNNRVAVDFTYYYQKTTDALFSVRQIPSLGFQADQVDNVGEMQNKGIELAVKAIVLDRPDFGWDLGVSVYTNHSKVLDLGGAPDFSLGAFGWIIDGATAEEKGYKDADGNPVTEGLPIPVIKSDCIRNPDGTIAYYSSTVMADPIYDDDCIHGPNLPTLTLGFNTMVRLPKGLQLAVRGEYQGGHYMYDGAAWNALRRSVRWPACFDAYPALDAGNLSEVSNYLQATCIVANADDDYLVYPADFFKLREVSLRIPITSFVTLPGATSASLTLSARNAWKWVNKDFPLFEPEMMGNEGLNDTVRFILEHVPPPATYTASLRVTF